METRNIEGGCMCGEVRYRATAVPKHSTICHCSDCRRACGAQSVAWVTFAAMSFTFESDPPGIYRSSEPVVRTFCINCGTSLTYEHNDRPDDIDVTTGSLDDPEAFPPTKEVFPEQKLSWV